MLPLDFYEIKHNKFYIRQKKTCSFILQHINTYNSIYTIKCCPYFERNRESVYLIFTFFPVRFTGFAFAEVLDVSVSLVGISTDEQDIGVVDSNVLGFGNILSVVSILIDMF